jgi:PAS domain S-box-containing protein
LATAPDPDRHHEWVATWREAVHASPVAVGLIELATHRFIELSPGGAELLGTTPEEGVGLDYLKIVEPRQEAAYTNRLAREGRLDGLAARRRFKRPDGSVIEVRSSGWVIRSRTGPPLALWVAGDVVSETEQETVTDDLAAQTPAGQPVVPGRYGDRLTGAILDEHWRVAHISSDTRQLLGQGPAELIGKSMMELTHPDDATILLLTFARATTEMNATVQLRLRHRSGTWQAVRAVVTVVEPKGAAARFGFGFTGVDDSGAASRVRIEQLERHLRRIAAGIQAADVWGASGASLDVVRLPAFGELSNRQLEVLSRLMRGERVPAIATEMSVSQSTIRNHLAAIFRKMGVHSQAELLSLLRQADDPSTEG